MQQNLVLWGDIGTDRKALLAIYLDEAQKKVMIHAFPKEEVSVEFQNSLIEWKNGNPFEFPADGLIWEVDANGEDVLPREIRVDKPEYISRAREFWTKRLMSGRLVAVCREELALIRQLVENSPHFEEAQKTRTQELWEKIQGYKKEHDLNWEQAQELKLEIDGIFEMLKAKKRLAQEKEKDDSRKFLSEIEKEVDHVRAQLVYPEEWNQCFDQLRKLQEKVKAAPLPWNKKRPAQDKINELFESLRQYKKTQFTSHTKERIAKLKQILKGLEQNLAKDQSSLKAQKDKLSFYIRGNAAASDWGGLLKITEQRIKEKEEKIADIKKTLTQLEKKLRQEEQQPVKAASQSSEAPNKDAAE